MTEANKSSIIQGIWFMMIAMFIFSVINVLIKDSIADFDPAQLVFFRCFFATIPTGIYLILQDHWETPSSSDWKIHIIRAILFALGLYLLFYGIGMLPLSTSISLYFSTTFFLVILSYPILKERVNLYQCGAVVIGFLGVLIISQPGWNVLYGGVVCMIVGSGMDSAHNLFGRRLSTSQNSSMISFLGSLLPAGILVFALPSIWMTPSPRGWVALIGLGIGGGIGQLCITLAYQRAPAGILAPTIYTALLWSVLLDVFIYNNWPDISFVIGCCMIIVAGTLIFIHERKQVFDKKHLFSDA